MMNMEQMFQQMMLKRMFGNLSIPQNLNDPVQIYKYLQSSGQLKEFGIPEGMTNPDQITQYMLQSGKLKQEQYNEARGEFMNFMRGGN